MHSEPLTGLEEEHQRLSDKRKRLHEAIDVMERAGSLKPDTAALLARYKQTERGISWDRGVLYRKIEELRAGIATNGPAAAAPADDLLRRIQGDPIDRTPDPAGTAGVADPSSREVGLA